MAWLTRGENDEICSLAKSAPVHLQIGASKRLLSFASRTCTFPVNGELVGRLSTFMLQYDPDLSYKDLSGVIRA